MLGRAARPKTIRFAAPPLRTSSGGYLKKGGREKSSRATLPIGVRSFRRTPGHVPFLGSWDAHYTTETLPVRRLQLGMGVVSTKPLALAPQCEATKVVRVPVGDCKD